MDLYTLIYHLKRCPEDFLRHGDDEKLPAFVLLKDIYRRIYGNFNVSDNALPVVTLENLNENHLFSIQIGCWFFSHPFFLGKATIIPSIHSFLVTDLATICPFVKYREWVEDDDRVEEFVRRALKICGIVPDGETSEVAAQRLDSLDTVKRQEVLKASNESFERIMEIRRQMAEKKAREAANVYGRE